MAKSPSGAASRVRKKVRKNIADGIAHVHASFNNTIRRLQVVKVSRALASPHLSQLK
ncbi:MAG: hypothetical protein RL707_428 [Pseudomonadota bacterium]